MVSRWPRHPAMATRPESAGKKKNPLTPPPEEFFFLEHRESPGEAGKTGYPRVTEKKP